MIRIDQGETIMNKYFENGQKKAQAYLNARTAGVGVRFENEEVFKTYKGKQITIKSSGKGYHLEVNGNDILSKNYLSIEEAMTDAKKMVDSNQYKK